MLQIILIDRRFFFEEAFLCKSSKNQLSKFESVVEDFKKGDQCQDILESALSANPHLYPPCLFKLLREEKRVLSGMISQKKR